MGSLPVYGSGDVDYDRIPAAETDNACGCGPFSFDADHQMRVTFAVPVGASSGEICMNTDSSGFPAASLLQR